MRGAVVLLRQLFLPPCHFAGQTNDHVVFIGLSVNRDGAECSAFDLHGLTLMISARGPDSTSADEPGIDVRAPLLRVARRTPRPLHPSRPASAEASNRAVDPASNPFPSGLLPSGLGMAKPTIPQARDRAEVLWGRYTPGMGHERRFPGTSGNGRPKRARECLLKVMGVRIARSPVELPERGRFQPLGCQ